METLDLTAATTDHIEQILVGLEAEIGTRRHLQMSLITELDRRQVPMIDGSRTLAEWAAARMDLSPETARTLTQTARRLADQPGLATELQEGAVSFDRATEESRLIATGASPEVAARSRGWDVAGVRRMVARHQHITRRDEQQTFAERSIMIQPSLDQTFYKLWGQLPGIDGRLLEQALTTRADQFPALPDQTRSPRNQRYADALVSIAHDSLNGTQTDANTSAPVVSIFIDANLATATNGETGAQTAGGPRIGPQTLEQILCHGSVEILMTAQNGPRSRSDPHQEQSHPNSNGSSSTATEEPAPPTDANPATGSNPTTSNPDHKAAHTIHRI